MFVQGGHCLSQFTGLSECLKQHPEIPVRPCWGKRILHYCNVSYLHADIDYHGAYPHHTGKQWLQPGQLNNAFRPAAGLSPSMM